MFFARTHKSLAVLSVLLLLNGAVLTGCGRSPVDPLAPGEPVVNPDDPGAYPDDPGAYPDDPLPFPPDFPGAGGEMPAPPPPPGVAPGPSQPGMARPALRPLPRPTPTPPPASGGGGVPADPAADMTEFIELLSRFGYDPGARDLQNVRMQVATVKRVPRSRLHWMDGPSLGLIYGRRVREFPQPIPYAQWKADGLNLAARTQGVSYYVGRRALYRDILRDRYNDTGSDAELVLYKRLNRTPFFVSYRADGRIDDYGYFRVDDWRNFLPVPAAFWQ